MSAALQRVSDIYMELDIGYSTMQREAAKKGCPVIRRTSKGPLYFNEAKLLDWWERSSVV